MQQSCAPQPVLVEVSGWDPDGHQRVGAPFYKALKGRTVLSASGLEVNEISRHPKIREGSSAEEWGWVLVPASLLLPFLTSAASRTASAGVPLMPDALLPGTSVHITSAGKSTVQRRTAALLGSILVQEAAVALRSVLKDLKDGSSSSWGFGWALAGQDNGQCSSEAARSPQLAPTLLCTYAVLLVQHATTVFQAHAKNHRTCPAATCQSQPQPSLGVGVSITASPFGCLAPYHFASSIFRGTLSAIIPRTLSCSSIWPSPTLWQQKGGSSALQGHDSDTTALPLVLFLDAVCFPGMEGGPVYLDNASQPLALLCTPLLRSSDALQMHLALSFAAVYERLLVAVVTLSNNTAAAAAQLARSNGNGIARALTYAQDVSLNLHALPLQPWHKLGTAEATPVKLSSEDLQRSVVMIRAGRQWATGAVVSCAGHILTNAHLLVTQESMASEKATPPAPNHYLQQCQVRVLSQPSAATGTCISNEGGRDADGSNSKLVTTPTYLWLSARVLHVWRNHLDMALLQLEEPLQYSQLLHVLRPPFQLHSLSMHTTPAIAGEACHSEAATSMSSSMFFMSSSKDVKSLTTAAAAVGSVHAGQRVFVVGHGLFGPRVGWPAAVSAGNVTKVVAAGKRPSMLITSASVHSGASGGAVLDAETHALVGLVTSNARHMSGTTLPRLNFCIAIDELLPLMAWTTMTAVAAKNDVAGCEEALKSLDVPDAVASRVWDLLDPLADDCAAEGACMGGCASPHSKL